MRCSQHVRALDQQQLHLPDVDTALVPIAAGDTPHFYYYFYSTAGDAIGFTRVGMRNENSLNSGFMRDVWGVSEGSVGIGDAVASSPLVIVPNPATDHITVMGAGPNDAFEVCDMAGRIAMRFVGAHADVSGLAEGSYQLNGSYARNRTTHAKFMVRH